MPSPATSWRSSSWWGLRPIWAVTLAVLSAPTILSSLSAPIGMMNGLLYMDALSGYIMALVIVVGLASDLGRNARRPFGADDSLIALGAHRNDERLALHGCPLRLHHGARHRGGACVRSGP